MTRTDTGRVSIAEGFPGQRMLVLPRPQMAIALAAPGTSHLLVSDCGYFPEAASHGRRRATGISQAVVMLCTRGAGWCETPDGRFPVGAGQAVILPPGTPHAYGADIDTPWTLWWVHLAGQDLPDLLAAAGATAAQPVREVADMFRSVALVREIVEHAERDSTAASLLAAAGAAWHLLTVLAEHIVGHRRSGAIDRAADHLRENLLEHVGVTELATMARLSPSHFAALFRKQFGVPVLQYQTGLRMARARELLDTTDLAVSAVAHASGYPDSFYFSRQFTRVHGLSPVRYRAQHKG